MGILKQFEPSHREVLKLLRSASGRFCSSVAEDQDSMVVLVLSPALQLGRGKVVGAWSLRRYFGRQNSRG